MPMSATGSKSEGFTLIELMVVITIIGVMSTSVVLLFPDPRGSLVSEAERFAARALAVRDEAVIGSRETALSVDRGGYAFERRRKGVWGPLDDKPFARELWSDGTVAMIADSTGARVTFDPTGLASVPLHLTLERGNERIAIDLETDGTIRVGS